MAGYFEAINNNNSTLIDDQYSNYAFWMKGTVVTSAWLGIAVGARVKLPSNQTGAYPIVALVHEGYVNLLGNLQVASGEWETNFILSDTDTATGVTLEWYAFLPSDTPEISLKQTGLFCLWNADGKPIFDSDADYMRVVDFRYCTYPQSINTSYPTGRKYAVVVAANQLYVRPARSPGGWGSLSGVSARVRSNGTASYSYVRLRTLRDGQPNPNSFQNQSKTDTGAFIILDVTNI